jgi:hypothetical protein
MLVEIASIHAMYARADSSLWHPDRLAVSGVLQELALMNSIQSKFQAVLNECKKDTERAVRQVSFWRSSGWKCVEDDDITDMIENQVKAIRSSEQWLEYLKANRPTLAVIINRKLLTTSLSVLDESIRPYLLAERYRNTVDPPQSQGFRITGIESREDPSGPRAIALTGSRLYGATDDAGLVTRTDELIR